MGRFDNKVAIVTGGAGGIGLATMEYLAAEGCKVAFSDLSPVGGQIAADLCGQGRQIEFIQGDMADESTCRSIVARTIDKWGQIHYLVNNAFSFISKGINATRADWDRMMHAGPVAYAAMAALCAGHMKAAGGGAIVNVSSISAFIAQPNRWTYNAAKAAVHNLTKCQAMDLAPLGIRVNSVSPGWTWTNEVLKAAKGDRGKWAPIWGRFCMLRRLAEPVEIARAIAFLLSDDASFITAVDLPVDGGYQGMGPEGLGDELTFAGSE